MKVYMKKPEKIVAQQIDFTSWQTLCALDDFMSNEAYSIVHEPGDRYPVLIYQGSRYEQGDYIVKDSSGRKYKMSKNKFEIRG